MNELTMALDIFRSKVVSVKTPREMFMGKLDFSSDIGWYVQYGSVEKFQPIIKGICILPEHGKVRLTIITSNVLEDTDGL